MNEGADNDRTEITTGEMVFNGDGQPLGLVTNMTDDGFEVGTREATDPHVNDQEEIPGQGLGEGYLMWRCGECGEMGELEDGIPSTCPNCGAPEEEISEARED